MKVNFDSEHLVWMVLVIMVGLGAMLGVPGCEDKTTVTCPNGVQIERDDWEPDAKERAEVCGEREGQRDGERSEEESQSSGAGGAEAPNGENAGAAGGARGGPASTT